MFHEWVVGSQRENALLGPAHEFPKIDPAGSASPPILIEASRDIAVMLGIREIATGKLLPASNAMVMIAVSFRMKLRLTKMKGAIRLAKVSISPI
jgi:hypothetical protein